MGAQSGKPGRGRVQDSGIQEYGRCLGGAATVPALFLSVLLVPATPGEGEASRTRGCPSPACFLPSEFFNTLLPLQGEVTKGGDGVIRGVPDSGRE